MRKNSTSTWITTEKSDYFTSDELINAYLTGKREALEATKRLAIDKLSNNINKSGVISLNLLKSLADEKFTPLDAYLRINAIDNFDIMVTIPENEMTGDDFINMYRLVSNIEEKSRDEYYDVFISFCPFNDHFEEINIESDGYFLKLEKNDRERPRGS